MTDAELTRAVAERLYGAENVAMRDMCDGIWQALCRWVGGDASRDDDDFWDPIPDYATDLNAAWDLYCRTPMEWRPDADNCIDRSAAEFSRACCEAFLAATEGR